jgi:hypothetical protein
MWASSMSDFVVSFRQVGVGARTSVVDTLVKSYLRRIRDVATGRR